MIQLEDVTKIYRTNTENKVVLNKIQLEVKKGEKVGILGLNGTGKSTLIRIVSGAEKQTSGKIIRNMSISWPLAFSGAFQGSLNGIDNVRFICRIYNIPIPTAVKFVEDFSELGKYLYEPVKKYSSGMRAKLAFAISMAVEFDCFLIDEIVAVGDQRFHEKCHKELFEKRKDRALIIVSHQKYYIKEYCTRASVLKGGKLTNFTNVEDAFIFYENEFF